MYTSRGYIKERVEQKGPKQAIIGLTFENTLCSADTVAASCLHTMR